jgi:hypothetical protein
MNMMKLNAYRFSQPEMTKMLWLKELFENNGFVIDRFPEVYYDTYYNACNLYPSLRDEKCEEEETPDFLGVYIPDYTNQSCHDGCEFKRVNEGVIVLFEDRIYEFAKRLKSTLKISVKTIEDSIRYLVLCHELGHWLAHWPADSSGLRWDCRYYFNTDTNEADKITHEALAQLITYWCADGRPLEELILREHLTPTRSDSEYRKYLALVGISKVEILERLKLLRANMGCDAVLNDESAYDLLKTPSFLNDIQIWAKERSIRKVDLNLYGLKTLKQEIVNDFIVYRYGLKIEYDYILCLLEEKGVLDDHAITILKFDTRFCI